jgi:hypothetical protein
MINMKLYFSLNKSIMKVLQAYLLLAPQVAPECS